MALYANRLYQNNFTTTLSSSIDDNDTTIPLTSVSGLGTLVIGDNSYYRFTISNGAGDVEIIDAESITGSSLTDVTRGVEGTAAVAWNSGDTIEIRVTETSVLNGVNLTNMFASLPGAPGTVSGDELIFSRDPSSGTFKLLLPSDVAEEYNTFNSSQINTAGWLNTTDDTLALDNDAVPTNEMVKAYVDDSLGTPINSFSTIAVSGQSNVVADSGADTLTFVAGSGMTITTNAGTDTITFSSSGGGGQTPWTSNIDTAGYSLTNVSTSGGVTVTTNNTLTLEGAPVRFISTTVVELKGGTSTATPLRLFEGSSNGTSYVGIKAPDDITGSSYTLTLPQDDGSSNQFLQTDGSGVLTWANPTVSDGDKGDITVASSGTAWTIDTPSLVTVATDDKVLIKDTSSSNVMAHVTTQSIRDLTPGTGTMSSADLRAALTDEVGTGAAYFVGGALGTPASGTLTNATGLPLTTGVTGTLPIANGGTAVTSVTTSPTASSFAGWDANSNLSSNRFIEGYASTVTAAGTTTLTVSSAGVQVFTGSTTQTVTMPVVSTLAIGTIFKIINLSSGVVTVQSSGANSIQAMAANTTLVVVSNATTGTGAGVWYVIDYTAAASGITGTGSLVRATSPTFVTPVLGTPTSGILTNATGLPLTTGVTGILPVANGGTGISTAKSNTYFKANTNSATSLVYNTVTKINLNNEVSDPGNTFDSTTNYRHTPNVAGTYLYIGMSSVAGQDDGGLIVSYVYKNGAEVARTLLMAGAASNLYVPVVTMVEMNGSTDYVELYSRQVNIATSTKAAVADSNYNFLVGMLVS